MLLPTIFTLRSTHLLLTSAPIFTLPPYNTALHHSPYTTAHNNSMMHDIVGIWVGMRLICRPPQQPDLQVYSAE